MTSYVPPNKVDNTKSVLIHSSIHTLSLYHIKYYITLGTLANTKCINTLIEIASQICYHHISSPLHQCIAHTPQELIVCHNHHDHLHHKHQGDLHLPSITLQNSAHFVNFSIPHYHNYHYLHFLLSLHFLQSPQLPLSTIITCTTLDQSASKTVMPYSEWLDGLSESKRKASDSELNRLYDSYKRYHADLHSPPTNHSSIVLYCIVLYCIVLY